MSDALLLLVMTLAAFRVWRLIGEDTILDRPRDWVIERSEKLSDFITCPWCAGFWISGVTVAVTDYFTSVPLPGLMVAAVSAGVGLIGSNFDA